MASEGKTVDIAGHKISRTEATVFGVAAVGIIAYAVIEKRKSAAAAASQQTSGTGTSAQFTDPAGNACAAPNPETGFCPGTPEDISATEQLSAGSTGYGLAGGSGLDTTGTVAGNGGILNFGSSVPTFTDNGSWGQYVEQQLGSNGSDAIAAAIAKYLNGQSLTSAQVTTVEEAVAIANYPPVNGAGGYPPSMNVTTSSNTNTISVPNVVGMSVSAAEAALSAAGLKADASKTSGTVASQAPAAGTMAASGATVTLTVGTAAARHYGAPSGYSDTPYDTYVDLGWKPVAGARDYHYQVLAGNTVTQDQVTATTSARVTGLKPGTGYKWRVSADPDGSWTPFKSFTTKK